LSGRQLFIYWRCAVAHQAEAQAATRDMQTALCLRHPGLSAELFLRVDDSQAPAGEVTLMETYAFRRPQPGLEAGVDPALQVEVQAAGVVLSPWLSGSRHVEVFDLLV
jgi:hypothetical protein